MGSKKKTLERDGLIKRFWEIQFGLMIVTKLASFLSFQTVYAQKKRLTLHLSFLYEIIKSGHCCF